MTSFFERDPKKRRVKPVGTAPLLDFDLGESSDDSDFRIEDHCEESDDDSEDSNDIGKEEEDASEESDDSLGDPLLSRKENPNLTVGDVIEQARQQAQKGGPLDDKLNKMLICCGCLGDRSDDINEIVECDGCGVSVHEGCYGVSDVESFSSTDSLCQSAPWFCEACSAGIEDPSCELCPNKGGIFKETDVGKWVHLVCALYVPGVAFGEVCSGFTCIKGSCLVGRKILKSERITATLPEAIFFNGEHDFSEPDLLKSKSEEDSVDRLSSVTLFEMAYSKWGAKQCSLCEDARFARTGVCIECDAGMCHTYFHVTCAQREGLLSEAHSEEVDQADPFYAHCKLHSDKTLVRRRRRNWLALQLRAQYRQQLLKQPNHLDTEEQRRIQRKLSKHRHKYLAHKASRPPPWVPTQKMPRLLTTSASACRQLARKAELMGVDTAALEAQEAQLVALVDVRKKWHIPPAFSVEFIGYYLDRNLRVTSMKRRLQELVDINSQLLNEQQRLDRKYDEVMKDNEEQIRVNVTLKEKIEMYHQVLQNSGYGKPLPQITDLAKPRIAPTLGTGLGVPTAAALKMGVGFPLPVGKGIEGLREGRVLSSQAQDQNHKGELTLRHQCGICRRSTNQHLLAKCDTCHLHYHLSCLSPPLSRMPKKTKLMGWQCSECDKESSGSEVERVDTSAPRKLRHCKDDSNLTSTPPQEVQAPATPTTPSTSKNSSTSLNSVANITAPDTPTTPKVTIKPVGPQPLSSTPIQSGEPVYNHQPINNVTIATREGSPEYMVASADGTESVSQRSAKKRRREKHKRYTPDPITGVKQRKRKHKRKSLDVENPEVQSQPEVHRRITIKIKPIPRPEGEVASESSPQMFIATSTSTEITSPPPPKLPPPPVPPLLSNTAPVTANVPTNSTSNRVSTGNAKKGKDTDLLTHCNVCDMPGTNQNLVMCDECKKCYHFTCLDPPVKKSPKRRGYSWHCADCDPSASESET